MKATAYVPWPQARFILHNIELYNWQSSGWINKRINRGPVSLKAARPLWQWKTHPKAKGKSPALPNRLLQGGIPFLIKNYHFGSILSLKSPRRPTRNFTRGKRSECTIFFMSLLSWRMYCPTTVVDGITACLAIVPRIFHLFGCLLAQSGDSALANSCFSSVAFQEPCVPSHVPPNIEAEKLIFLFSLRRLPQRNISLPSHDLLRGAMLLIVCCLLQFIDASRIYHTIRGQSAIKLYVIFNVFEVSTILPRAVHCGRSWTNSVALSGWILWILSFPPKRQQDLQQCPLQCGLTFWSISCLSSSTFVRPICSLPLIL